MAIMFAVGSACLIAAVAVAVDVSYLLSRKSNLQDATDAAILAAAISGETEKAELDAIARKAFDENYNFREGEELETFSLTILPENELDLNTRTNKDAILAGFFGKGTLAVNANSATYLMSAKPLDVALVLDRTGSMAGDKMAGLISAASDYMTALEGSGRDIRVSVVPFSDYVNIGTDNSITAWIEGTSSGSDIECTMESASMSSCEMSSSNSPPPSSFFGSTMWTDMFTNSSGTYCSMNTDLKKVPETKLKSVFPRYLAKIGSVA
jgi:Flp pilus assembly protein TadG